DKLVEHTQPTRDRHTPPLIQTVFTGGNVTGIADGPVPLHTATMRPMSIEPGTAKFDLTVHAEVGTDSVGVYFSYACDLYDAATMADLADSYRALVAAVLADPERRLSTVEAVTDEQRRRLAAVSTGRRRRPTTGRAARWPEAVPDGPDRAGAPATEVGAPTAAVAGSSDGGAGCVPWLVTATARRQPDAVAIVDGTSTIT
ncbi:condensation domain-containing protein, partial [Micromonospora sp. LOL_025]|uniref:condensation domain-containing protein n=1 Tax=Micromonospora sp. LOL_025 TaxID=3345413 RepID=UPI003A8AA2FF